MVGFGLHYWGFKEMEMDEKALKDRQIKALGDANIQGLHSTLYNRLKPPGAAEREIEDIESGIDEKYKSSRSRCPICLESYGERDRVTVLQCENMHMAHTGCLQESIIS